MDIASVVWLCPELAPYAVYLAAVVGIAAVVASLLPPPTPSSPLAYRLCYIAVNWLGRNVRYAANAGTAPKTGG
jgi:di/tricarboxylate transporter